MDRNDGAPDVACSATLDGEGGLHMYEITEAGCVWHWVVASSSADALVLVAEMDVVEEPEELEVERIEDERTWRVSYVDGWDFPERWQDEVPPGALVTTNEACGYPEVTATAGEWVRFWGRGYVGCSEDA